MVKRVLGGGSINWDFSLCSWESNLISKEDLFSLLPFGPSSFSLRFRAGFSPVRGSEVTTTLLGKFSANLLERIVGVAEGVKLETLRVRDKFSYGLFKNQPLIGERVKPY
ncbi:uncharacterized protein LOC131147831 [Malania oleifera]|uniref:uncharacterized protein LOC131147831 n=1 Tax=Malania oleifera TaxID=397392 RepID=UPI0025ADDCCC|nr:uncharacterized protein LOC131147831 [Malania oleifera]